MTTRQVTEKFLSENQAAFQQIFDKIGWSQPQIEGQISKMKKLVEDSASCVFIALESDQVVGYVSAEFYPWNRLSQIHGLAVDPNHRKKGFATKLLSETENFMKTLKARGIFLDTPANNLSGCIFYQKKGFQHGYTMPSYYDQGVDGVTFIKFFEP